MSKVEYIPDGVLLLATLIDSDNSNDLYASLRDPEK